MSDAYKCNGCGEFVKGNPTATIETTLLRCDVDLCSGCAHEFKAKYRE